MTDAATPHQPQQGKSGPARTVAEHMAHLGEGSPFDQAAGWDPVGLQLGDPQTAVSLVAVCHEVTDGVVAAVLGAAAGLLVTYHPLLFRSTRRLVAGPTAEGRAYRLVSGGVSLVVVHTAFDVARGGTADALAEALDLSASEGFGPLWGKDRVTVTTLAPPDAAEQVLDAIAAAGAGIVGPHTSCSFRSVGISAADGEEQHEERIEVVADASRVNQVITALVRSHPESSPRYDVTESKGNAGFVGRVGRLESPTALSDLVAVVDERLGCVSRVAAGTVHTVQRVAVLPGAGGSSIAAAAETRAEVLVTGDVTHHEARMANELGMAVIDAGHAPTERPGVRKLYAAVSASGSETLDLTQLHAHPWEAP